MKKLSMSLFAAALLCMAQAVSAGVSQWVVVNHVGLRYQIDGDGPNTLVLLQESGAPLEIWEEILPELLAPQRRILRYDPRGIGLSEKIRTPVTMQDQVDDLRALLDALEIREPVVMIGGALGASVAMMFASQFPERVKALAVTSPSAQLQPRPPRARINPAVDPEGARAAEKRAKEVTYPVELRGNVQRWERYQAIKSSSDPDSEILTEAIINTTPFADVLPKIQCPTLVIATSMFVRPVEDVKVLADLIPNSEFMVLKTGHVPAFQTPELMAPVFKKFLKKYER
jgi:3-oxoadipate enol-lactonase